MTIRDWSRVRKWDRVGTRELLGPTGTGTVKFHREQNVRMTARISRHIATCKEKSRHDLTKMRQRRSSALGSGPEPVSKDWNGYGPESSSKDRNPTRVLEVRDQSLQKSAKPPFRGCVDGQTTRSDVSKRFHVEFFSQNDSTRSFLVRAIVTSLRPVLTTNFFFRRQASAIQRM